MSRLDEYALEIGLCIRESLEEGVVEALSLGEEPAEDVLRRALGMGADKAVHLWWGEQDADDSLQVARAIAGVASTRQYDLILTGSMSEDRMQGVTGPLIAAFLGWPLITSVTYAKMEKKENAFYVIRETEGGNKEVFSAIPPVLLGVQSGMHPPRYPSLSHMLRARKAEIETINEETESVSPFPAIMRSLSPPGGGRQGVRLSGSPEEKAEKLVQIFLEKGFL